MIMSVMIQVKIDDFMCDKMVYIIVCGEMRI